MEQRVRVGLHCIVGGLMHLLSLITYIPKLHTHIEAVCSLCIHVYAHTHVALM